MNNMILEKSENKIDFKKGVDLLNEKVINIRKSLLTNEPMKEALDALKSDEKLNVIENDRTITFEPKMTKAEKGLIFYPGALVDARSYSVIARTIAEEGFKVVVLKLPFSGIAVAPRRGKIAFKENPEIKKWAVAAHSQGGLSAGMFVSDNLELVKGIAFWGSFPINDLSNKKLEVVSIIGSKDGLIKQGSINESLKKLPINTKNVIIEGGNHGNFGHYGNQFGDNVSTITREEQQKITILNTIELLKTI